MKTTKTKTGFQVDIIIIFDKKVEIYFTSTGYYYIKLDNKFSNQDNFKLNIILVCNNTEQLSSLEKNKIALNDTFFHPHSDRLLSILQDCRVKILKLHHALLILIM